MVTLEVSPKGCQSPSENARRFKNMAPFRNDQEWREWALSVSRKLDLLIQQGGTLMATAQDVLAAVQDETTVEQSVIALLDQISALLQAAKTDPAVLDQVVSLVTTNKQALAAAVTRNTPSEPI